MSEPSIRTPSVRSTRRRARGQPLVVLVALLLGWAGARVTGAGGESSLSLPEQVLTVETATAAQSGLREVSAPAGAIYPGPQTFPDWRLAAAYSSGMPPAIQYVPVWVGEPMPRGSARVSSVRANGQAVDAGSRQAFYAGYPLDRPLAPGDRGELPAGMPSLFAADGRPVRTGAPDTILEAQLGAPVPRSKRWSMDIWALLRGTGGKVPAAGTLPAVYGASQAGGVVRYRLADDTRRPSAYLRTTSTLGGLAETSIALGLSARPLARVPVILAAEGRLTDQAGARRVQPAITAVTELPPLALPRQFRAEVYGQAGYVAGRYATPFADGQARVDRQVVSVAGYEARLGAGLWGGIQKGASRLDAGPGATVAIPLNPKVFGRVALDWRFKVAGDAEPDSGPALTVAAGF